MKKKKEEQTFSSVLSVNPYTQEYFSAVSSIISKVETPQYLKNQYVVSFLSAKDIIYGQIKISKNIPQEDIYDAIYTKAYDELVLDQAIEYQIQIVESHHELDEENRTFHVFIVDPQTLENVFTSTLQKVKYIDLIVPEPILIKSLYTKEIIDSNGVDCFIYLHETNASITLYKDKEFLYTKPIKFSIEDLYERFCEIYGNRIEYNEFKTFISTENLKYTQAPYLHSIIKLYKEFFSNINDVITYVKRAFEIDKIQRIYIGTGIYFESKLDEMLEAEIGVKVEPFEFDFGLEYSQGYVDQLHSLLYLYTTLPDDEQKYLVNFSKYPRPPKFFKRESGKLITVFFASLIIAFIYPVTYWILTYTQGLQLDLLKDKYSEVHNIRVTREAAIKEKQAELDKAKKLLSEEKDTFKEKKATLIKIREIKNSYLFKAKILAEFTQDLNKFQVRLEQLEYDEINNKKVFTFHLVAKYSSRITKFLQYITVKYDGIFSFSLEKIYYDKESKAYFSTLRATKL